MPICKISGKSFEISDFEKELRQKLNAPLPDKLPKYTFQELAAFWHHFAIHKRKCDLTGKTIISAFDENCPYPVWDRDYWIKNSDPPQAEFDFNKPFFDQLWELFQTCPIPHNVGLHNQNCEYTDDWWYSKNCYLCHSGVRCENCYYCYRTVNLKDCMYCVFCFDSELSIDLINCHNCFSVKYALNCRNCRDSAFLFDCFNCHDCLFCWNLRNKEYCIENKQYSRKEYEKEKQKFNFSSRKSYNDYKKKFLSEIKSKAWWKAANIEKSENSIGNHLENCKNCINCFYISDAEDCVNAFRGGVLMKDCLDVASQFNGERLYYSSMAQDHCYEIRFSVNIVNSKYMEYCAHCLNCQYCFGCCGLVNKKYCILNKQYSQEEYLSKVSKIHEKMEKDGILHQFFPKYFAASAYDESLAGFHWPLSLEEQKKQGFRIKILKEQPHDDFLSPENIPDTPNEASEDICQQTFWDDKAKRQFQITKIDLDFCLKNKVPLPESFYIRRIKENFALLFCDCELRKTTCAKTGKNILTSLPDYLDGRILSREAYLEEIY